ncbi:hypothetical protein [Nesterenkonia massiliensis]|uniref:hypothetical protein n=1 Tax=Nesterenkonia massiliensis TaxID=1232429 RepID=UPI000422D048|nr:hypothetical protein [Nesterenkonia massiliensis]
MKRAGIISVIIIVIAAAVAAVWATQRTSAEDEVVGPTPSPAESSLPAAPQPSPEDDEPAIEDAERERMEQLALEAAEVMTTWDPIEDFNQTEAELRAAHLMTDELAESIRPPERPTTGPKWLDAASAGATSRPSVEPNRATSDEVISVEATWVWITEEGSVISNPTERRLFFFTFEEVAGELLISDYSWESV